MERSVERNDLSNGNELDDDVLDRAVGGLGAVAVHVNSPPPDAPAPSAHTVGSLITALANLI
jgi:hypothetical protein